MDKSIGGQGRERLVRIAAGPVSLEGDLSLPHGAYGLVLFAHGSGSSRHSPRNRYVARLLNDANLATLLVDLLTAQEEAIDSRTGHLRFDIGLLAERLIAITDWLAQQPDTRDLRIGYFGASTGAGGALVAAAERSETVGAVVSRGGRPDLAAERLGTVRAPTLLIVGSRDDVVIDLNRKAQSLMTECDSQLVLVEGATHLFEEQGTLAEAASHARNWFIRHLPSSAAYGHNGVDPHAT